MSYMGPKHWYRRSNDPGFRLLPINSLGVAVSAIQIAGFIFGISGWMEMVPIVPAFLGLTIFLLSTALFAYALIFKTNYEKPDLSGD